MITFHLFVLSCFYSLLLCCAMLICSVMSNSFRPHGWQSTRILCPRGFSGQRMLGWVAMPSSRWSSQSRDRTQVSCIAGGFFTDWATREAQSLLLHAIKTHSSVQSLSPVQLFATPWTAAHQASLSITNYRSLLKLIFIVSVMPSNHLILCRQLLLPLQSFPATGSFQMSQFFTSGGQSIGVSVSPSVLEYSGLISFSIDWLDLLAVQGTLKSSPTQQFIGISSLALSFLYSPNSHIHAWLLENP